jgi:hypothetical protein
MSQAARPVSKEVELRRLDQALGEVVVVGLQQEHHVAGLEDRHPGARGVVGDPGVHRELRQVEELSGAAGAESDEPLKGSQVADVDELADIAFQVGLNVPGVPHSGVELPVVDGRVQPAPEHLVEVGVVVTVDLCGRKGQELHQGDPTGQRLRHP